MTKANVLITVRPTVKQINTESHNAMEVEIDLLSHNTTLSRSVPNTSHRDRKSHKTYTPIAKEQNLEHQIKESSHNIIKIF